MRKMWMQLQKGFVRMKWDDSCKCNHRKCSINSITAAMLCSVVSDSLRPHGLLAHQAPLSWNVPGKNTGTGCHALHQGIFPTQGSNPNLLQFLHCRWILYCWATRETHLPPLPTINALGQVPIISHLMDYCQSPIQVSSHYSPTSWFIPARVSHKAKSYDH